MDDQLIDAESIVITGTGDARQITVPVSTMDEAGTISARFRLAEAIAQGVMSAGREADQNPSKLPQ